MKAKSSEIEAILSKLDKIEDRLRKVEKGNFKTLEEFREVMNTYNQKTSKIEDAQKTLDQKISKIEGAQKSFEEKTSQLADLALTLIFY